MPWIPSSLDSRLPRSAIVGGRGAEGHSIYVGRAWVEGDLVPCSVIPGKKKAIAIGVSGKVEEVTIYEVLCGDVYSWKKARMGDVPGSALIAGRSKNGEELYIGRVVENKALYLGMIQPSRKSIQCPLENLETIEKEEYDVITIKTCEQGCGSCVIL